MATQTERPSVPTDLCGLLRQQLGPFGYQWLCACAIYPGLRFALTIHLGNVLASCVDRVPPDEEDIRALCSLEWFRSGSLPVDLRERLVSDLLKPFRKPVRLAIERYLFETIESGNVVSMRYAIVNYTEPPTNWTAAVRAFVLALIERQTITDGIFIKYMVRSRLASALFSIEGPRARALGASLAGCIDVPILTIFFLSFLFCGLTWSLFPPPAPPGAYVGQVIDFRWTYVFKTPNGRHWTYLGNGIWQEFYADMPANKFASLGRYILDGCPGTLMQKDNNLLQAFVPDRGCPKMIVRFIPHPNRPWQDLGCMSSIEYAVAWRGASPAPPARVLPPQSQQPEKRPIESKPCAR